MPPEPHDEVRTASFRDIEIGTFYKILKLRADVFVVEQQCAYADPDGRDDEVGTRHLWIERDGEVRAYARLLDDGDALRIGRVVTDQAARGQGLAGRLVEAAVAIIGNRPSRLHAQSHLAGFYTRFGYRPDGPEFVEDGIGHVPMLREAAQGSDATSSVTERSRPV
ncbi:MAG TPA: GNAT family N-acetyltransferase [Actinoplanes sp.]|jgi:ElaA protein